MPKKKTTKKDEPFNKNSEDKKYAFGTKDIVIPGSNAKGFEDVEAGDIIVPRILALQTLSPLVQDIPDKYISGMAISGSSGEILAQPAKEFYVQFISFYKSRILWVPKSEGGGMRCIAPDSKIGQGEFQGRVCASCPLEKWFQRKPPECILYFNFPLLYYGKFKNDQRLKLDTTKVNPTLMWLSLGKTNFKEGKSILNTLKFSGDDIFSYWIRVKTHLISNQKGKWYIFQPQIAEKVNESVKLAGSNGYNFLKAMKDSVKFRHDADSESDGGVEDNPEI